jgi:hypothetical protein
VANVVNVANVANETNVVNETNVANVQPCSLLYSPLFTYLISLKTVKN